MKKLLLLIVMAFCVVGFTNAQKITVESGDLKFLGEATELSTVFDYPENIKYGKITEKEYVAKKVSDKEKKEKGSGEEWKAKFYEDRVRYNEQFMNAIKNYTGDLIVAEDNPEFKYTMIVKTTFIEPGFYVGIRSKNSVINLEITFIETAAPDNVLATVKIIKATGGSNIDQGERVASAYGIAARSFGKYLKKHYL